MIPKWISLFSFLFLAIFESTFHKTKIFVLSNRTLKLIPFSVKSEKWTFLLKTSFLHKRCKTIIQKSFDNSSKGRMLRGPGLKIWGLYISVLWWQYWKEIIKAEIYNIGGIKYVQKISSTLIGQISFSTIFYFKLFLNIF